MRTHGIQGLELFVIVMYILIGQACSADLQRHEVSLNLKDAQKLPSSQLSSAIEFVFVPQGSFLMGSPETEEGRDTDEGPVHIVHIDSFFISKYEITQAQWVKVMGYNPSQMKGSYNLPVENVTWYEVQDFIRKLNKKTSHSYRLPTEAEWEYACRGGMQTQFSSGNDEGRLNNYAWFNNNAGNETHVVGTRLPNMFGIYDMHGNVNEWVEDGRRGYLQREEYNPRGDALSPKAICRGGCWMYPASLCRSANRLSFDKDYRSNIIGFRIAR
jgi:formylglycine-generating enzyme required for sulfatase activity